jgi:hypothetical protein
MTFPILVEARPFLLCERSSSNELNKVNYSPWKLTRSVFLIWQDLNE